MEYSHRMPQRNQISNVILSMGVELECSTTPKRIEAARRFFKRYGLDQHLGEQRDGSVDVYSPWPNSIPNAEITFWGPKKIDIKHFFEKMGLGKETRTNRSCGTHMHFRFIDREKAIKIFSSQEAWTEFRNAYIKFANSKPPYTGSVIEDPKYPSRLTNHFCEFPAIRPRIRVNDRFDRYYAINILSFYDVQNTLEIRIMPGFSSVKEAMEAVDFEIKVLSGIYKKYFNVPFVQLPSGAFSPASRNTPVRRLRERPREGTLSDIFGD